MGRPTKREKRNRQLNLKLTWRELAWVQRRAQAEGMRPVEFGRAQLFGERKVRKRSETAPHLDPLFLAHMARIGNNLNQIARRLNQFQIPAPSSLESVLESVRALMRRASEDGPHCF